MLRRCSGSVRKSRGRTKLSPLERRLNRLLPKLTKARVRHRRGKGRDQKNPSMCWNRLHWLHLLGGILFCCLDATMDETTSCNIRVLPIGHGRERSTPAAGLKVHASLSDDWPGTISCACSIKEVAAKVTVDVLTRLWAVRLYLTTAIHGDSRNL